MSRSIKELRPTVHVLIPCEVIDGELRSTDYDTPEFRGEMSTWFGPLGLDWVWHKICLENVPEEIDSLRVLKTKGEIVVMNLCDGSETDGLPGVSVVDALIAAGLRYTGADSEFYRNSTSKLVSKRMLIAGGVPTAPFVELVDGVRDFERAATEVGFPFIIKPDISAGSYGIQKDSVCYDIDSAMRKAAQLRDDRYFRRVPLFIEKFIEGREFTVFAIEDENEPLGLWVLTPGERVFNAKVPADQRYLIYERYWGLPEAERIISEGEAYYWYALAPEPLRAGLEDIARRAIRSVDGSGYARVDIRREEETGQMHVLEVNAQCGLSGSDEATVGSLLKLCGLTISEVVEKILQHAMNR